MAGAIIEGDALSEAYKAEQAELEALVSIKGEYITIQKGGGYNIPLAGCDTHERITAWTIQLTDKSWMSAQIVNRFVKLALEARKLGYPTV